MLKNLADIRPEERGSLMAASLTLFGTLAGHTLLETARDALFLSRLPASKLPWAYLAIAVLAVAISLGPRRRAPPKLRSFGFAALLFVCSGITALFWLLDAWESRWVLFGLYVWTGLLGTLTGVQFWVLLGELYTVTQAKRLYKIVGAASLLGAVAGALAARIITERLAAETLVLAAAAVLVATAIGPAMMLRRPPGAPASGVTRVKSIAEGMALARSNPYLVNLGGIVLVATVTLTLADYVFKSTVAREVPREQLAHFFSLFYLFLNILALLAQVFLMGLLLKLIGLHRSLWVLPALVLMGSTGIVFGGGVMLALLLKGADGTLRHSLHRTTIELLFVPIPDGTRSRVKPIIDVVGQRGGQALASLFILAELGVQRGDTVLAAAAAALSVIWIVLASQIREHYLNLFRSALREGAIRVDRDLPDLDLNSLEALFAALNSREDAEVIGALEFLAEQDHVHLIPALILYHPSSAVKLRALDLFVRGARTDFMPIADRLMSDPDPEVRAAALRARTGVQPDEALLRAARSDESAIVRSTALVGLISAGWVFDEASLDDTTPRELEICLGGPEGGPEGLLRSGGVEGALALAEAIRYQPLPVFADALLRLAGVPTDELRRAVARAMGEMKDSRFLPVLVSLLDSRETRGAARSALVAHGPEALEFLSGAMASEDAPRPVRAHIPRTVAMFEAQPAVDLLQTWLVDEADGLVRFKILSALGRLATDHPEVVLDQALLQRGLERTIRAVYQLIEWRRTLQRGARDEPAKATRGHDLLVTLLEDKEAHAVERIFRLLGLRHRSDDFLRIHRGLARRSAKVRANSHELLENLLEQPLRDAVLALVEDLPLGEKLSRGEAYYQPERRSYDQVLDSLLDEPSDTVRSLAAHHVGELGLTHLRGRLSALDAGETGSFSREVIERALRQLGGGPADGLAHAY